MQRKMDMKFRTWNVRSLYKAESLKTAASEPSVDRRMVLERI
jgi:hypothetical protein